MRLSAAHVSRLCWASSAPVPDAVPNARRSTPRSSCTDWSHEPEAVRLSPPRKRKEYRDHHTPPHPKIGPSGSVTLPLPPNFPAGLIASVKVSCLNAQCKRTNTECEGTGNTCAAIFDGPAHVDTIFGGGGGQLTCQLAGWECFCGTCPSSSHCPTARRQICLAKTKCTYVFSGQLVAEGFLWAECLSICPRTCQ
jgi:hypothetical protein